MRGILTMGAKTRGTNPRTFLAVIGIDFLLPRNLRGDSAESGQSLLEFMIILPLILGMIIVLLRANMATQMSIVNQQYARSQALYLAQNSPIYPEFRLRASDAPGTHQMLMGVSDNVPSGDRYQPKASEQNVTRTARPTFRDEDGTDRPRRRAQVRIRNTVTLCTQWNPSVSFPMSESGSIQFCGGNGE